MTYSKSNRKFRPLDRDRRGISILETMIAILVAMIGVFGVFVLIPFAVRQAETGLNEEAAMVIGRNMLANFEAQGYQGVGNWNDPEGLATGESQIYCIDPMGYTYGLVDILPADQAQAQTAMANFPKIMSPTAPMKTTFRRLSLQDRTGNAFTVAMARRMFGGSDDLVFTDATTELGTPDQIYDRVDNGAGVFIDAKRQTASRVSSMIFVVPQVADLAPTTPDSMPKSYRVYSVVYLDRTFDQKPYDPPTPTFFPPSGRPADDDRVFDVYMPGTYNAGSDTGTAPTGMQFGGGDFTIVEADQATDPEAEIVIRRNSWAMLVRVDNTGTPFVEEIGFYRTIEAIEDESTTTTTSDFDVSLQGPDFDFKLAATHETYLVMLPEVVAVYERTVRQEELSNWNDN